MKLKELMQLMEKVSKDGGISTPFVCGGVPRDKILGRLDKIEDLDITTGDETVKNLASDTSVILKQQYNITTKVADDGHSSIFLGNLKVDFSSNFNVPNIDELLKQKGINAPTAMQREIYSRDFTCNALLLSLDLKTVLDPTNQGLKDIKSKIIKTCLTPQITLSSNKNRVVRAIYLAAKLDFELDPELYEWIKANPKSIRFASDKALSEKLNKSIKVNPTKTVKLLNELGLWNEIPITKELYPFYIKNTKP